MRRHDTKIFIALCAALLAAPVSSGARADTDARSFVVIPDSEVAAPDTGTQGGDTVDTAADSVTEDVRGADADTAEKIPAEKMPVLELEVRPKEVAVGEVIHWSLEVRRLAEHSVHLSSGASFGDLELREKRAETVPAEDGWVTETLDVELLGFAAGEHEIPEQTLSVVDEAGRIVKVTTPGARVVVKSLIANEPEPELKADQGPGVSVYQKDYTLVWVLSILGGALVVALLTLLGRYLWSRRRPRPGPPPPPPRPAEEIALEKLEALERAGLVEEGRLKEYHVRMSEAVREYLGNRYGFDSLEMSTQELRAALKRTHIETWAFERACELLEETDLVKFAKYVLGEEESKTLLARAVDLVRRTTPRSNSDETPKRASQGRKAHEARPAPPVKDGREGGAP